MNLVTSRDGEDQKSTDISKKRLLFYIHNITELKKIHNSLSTTISDDFIPTLTKYALKLNVSSIDDYRSVTKKFDES